MIYTRTSNQVISLLKPPQPKRLLNIAVNLRSRLAGLPHLLPAPRLAPEEHQTTALGHQQAKAVPRIRLMQGPARFRRRPSFPSRLPPQRYRGPPLKRASGRLRHQSRPRCPPLSAQSPQSKQALGAMAGLHSPATGLSQLRARSPSTCLAARAAAFSPAARPLRPGDYSSSKRLAAVASPFSPTAYSFQLRDRSPGKRLAARAAKHSSASSPLQRSPPSETIILTLHRHTHACPPKRHRHGTPTSSSQHPSTDFSRNSGCWLQRRTKIQPQYLHIQN
ncbi:uncharacterized protein LOC131549778 [Onychostoma macrolepis]|uniref:uncharacterized protein LOC131549778 n=1 Tax=Onychostoma macrolepis TaxID=369639 RepID=UPI00272C2FBE|nr:uncharacterized protein LOC131549778 [Onychostoma macrolepis]